MKVLVQLAITYRVNDGGTTHAPLIVAEMGGKERRLIEVMHDPQGIVGMDVLRGSVLACAADLGRPVIWLVPSL